MPFCAPLDSIQLAFANSALFLQEFRRRLYAAVTSTLSAPTFFCAALGWYKQIPHRMSGPILITLADTFVAPKVFLAQLFSCHIV